MFDIRRSQKDSKGTTKEQNVPKETKLSQGSFKNSTKREPKTRKSIKIMPFFFIKFSIRNYKNGHGALVGIT